MNAENWLVLLYWYGVMMALGVWTKNLPEPQDVVHDVIDSVIIALWPITVSIKAGIWIEKGRKNGH